MKNFVTTKSNSRKAVAQAIARQDKETLKAPVVKENIEDAIRLKAYELYMQRGAGPGNDMEDWLTAEKIVLSTRK